MLSIEDNGSLVGSLGILVIRKVWPFNIIVDFPIKNGDFPIKHGDFPIKSYGFV